MPAKKRIQSIGIYKITNPKGKVYIGQSWEIEKRFKRYQGYQCTTQTKIHNSLVKYGWETHTFEIVHYLPKDVSQKIMDDYELLYTDLYKSCNIEMLNLKEGGLGGRMSEETKIKLRNILGPINRERAKTPEGKMHQSKGGMSNKGNRHSQETILKMRKNRTSVNVDYFDSNGNFAGTYPSQAEASRQLGISQPLIWKLITQNRKSRKGYTFKKSLL